MNNSRNKNGVKDSANTYLKGGQWQQWSDSQYSAQEAKDRIAKDLKEYPTYKFMFKKIYDVIPFWRIYYKETQKRTITLSK